MLQSRLITLRNIHNMKQEDVANHLGISRSTYAGYESRTKHNRVPNADAIIKLADLYDVSTDYILGRTSSHLNDHRCPNEAINILSFVNQLSEDDKKLFWKHLQSYVKLMEIFFRR